MCVSAHNGTERITGVLVALLLATLLGGCAARIADIGSVSIAQSEHVEADGAKLFLQVRGADRSAPVLLWLHGGPGGAERPLMRHFNGDLEDHFVVAYWDQRGTGRSFDPEADPRRLTIAQHLSDLNVIVEHLKRSFEQDRIVLIGHSWGSALGLLYAKSHPESVSAFIGVAQVVATREAQQAEYDFVLAEASNREDRDTSKRLHEIGMPPHETASQALAIERLTDKYGGVFHRKPNRLWLMLRGIFGGLVTPWEIGRFIRANKISLEAMNQELLDLDLRRSVPRVEVPVLFLLGRYDRHVNAALAAAYFEALQAPFKRLIWFEGSGHNVPFEEPELFSATVTNELQSIGIRVRLGHAHTP
jgi:proline iminopeptidase